MGQNDAVLTAHLDPIGAGNITGCEVEYGPTNSYGSTAACDQSLPLTQAGDATVHLAGLETETPYHYRFRAANGNGTTNGPDLTFTPHWVAGLETGDATDIGPGAATHPWRTESLPANRPTTTSNGARRNPTAAKRRRPPGAVTSAGALTQVEASLAGVLTSSTTYHYRLVAVNSLGTSFGSDREFTTSLAEPPQIRNVVATPTGLSTAVLNAELNPGFGDVAYRFQYGLGASYGNSTVITGPIADDGTFHPSPPASRGSRTGHHLSLPRHRLQLRQPRHQPGPGLHDAECSDDRRIHGNGDRCP